MLHHQRRHQVQALASMNDKILNTPMLPGFELIAINAPRRKKKGEQVIKNFYRESDLLDVGLVVDKARKQGGMSLLHWSLIEFYN